MIKEKRELLLTLALLGILAIPFLVLAQEFPSPIGRVNDFANLLSPNAKLALEQKLLDIESKTGAEVVVVTIPSLKNENLEDYTTRLFEKWGIGKKGQDNGALILVARDDRKVRIEVGYGLEGQITDGQAGEIIRTAMTPNFKNENYDEGIFKAVEKIESLIISRGAESPIKKSGRRTFNVLFGDLIILPLLFFTYIPSYLARSKSFWLGGVLGGLVGGVLGFLLTQVLLSALFFGGIVAVVGLVLDYFLSQNYQKMVARGRPTDFVRSWGGFWTGRRGGGSGFGGFGGGLSGGGGSSGDW